MWQWRQIDRRKKHKNVSKYNVTLLAKGHGFKCKENSSQYHIPAWKERNVWEGISIHPTLLVYKYPLQINICNELTQRYTQRIPLRRNVCVTKEQLPFITPSHILPLAHAFSKTCLSSSFQFFFFLCFFFFIQMISRQRRSVCLTAKHIFSLLNERKGWTEKKLTV